MVKEREGGGTTLKQASVTEKAGDGKTAICKAKIEGSGIS